MAYRRTRVYIAGPLSIGDRGANVAAAMGAWHALWAEGYAPFCPHLNEYLHQHQALAYEEWLSYDFEWLRCCDALLRLPGKSPGADREWVVARRLGIPTFYDIRSLTATVASQREGAQHAVIG